MGDIIKLRNCFALLLSISVTACANSIQIPVTGQLSDGTAAAGTATAKTNDEGEFWIQVPNSFKCSGKYNSRSYDPTLIVPISCTDGRSGQLVVTRQTDMISGTAIAMLDDGTTGQFVFGDITFEQQFGSGSVRTSNTQRVKIVQ